MRQDYHALKVSMRELEMGNDHLERSERAVASNLADLEAKYAKALEEKILLDHELLDKARLEEDFQRLKDEHRGRCVLQLPCAGLTQYPDSCEETTRLKRRLQELTDALNARALSTAEPNSITATERRSESTTSLPLTPASISSNDLLLSDLDTPKDPRHWLATANATIPEYSRPSLEEVPLGRKRSSKLSSMPAVSRANNPPYSQSTLPKRNPLPYPIPTDRPSFPKGSTASLVPSVTSKSKGVQMVSEMRTRVRNLELKIHSRLPRIRLGSVSRSAAPSPIRQASPSKLDKTTRATPTLKDGRRSIEPRDRKGAESPGWVLIMEESPQKETAADQKRRRRLSSPQAPSAFREPLADDFAPKNISTNTAPPGPLSKQRPVSTMSLSTQLAAVGTKTAKPSGPRPTTPTFLPVPTRAYPDPGSSTTGEPRRRTSLDRSTFAKSNFTKSTAGVPARRQSAEGTSNRRASAGRGIAASRSSLPGGPQTTERMSLETPEPHSRPESRSSAHSRLSTGNSILTKSRIGRPIKRESAGPSLLPEDATN
jgi:hypothetical protein